jgi:hypothetical protein
MQPDPDRRTPLPLLLIDGDPRRREEIRGWLGGSFPEVRAAGPTAAVEERRRIGGPVVCLVVLDPSCGVGPDLAEELRREPLTDVVADSPAGLTPERLTETLRPLAAPALPGRVGSTPARLRQQFARTQQWLARRENVEGYAGQVVAIHDAVVWGSGPDHATAVRAAERALAASAAAAKPAPEDLAYLVVPELGDAQRPVEDD